jgi:hypothetical protein
LEQGGCGFVTAPRPKAQWRKAKNGEANTAACEHGLNFCAARGANVRAQYEPIRGAAQSGRLTKRGKRLWRCLIRASSSAAATVRRKPQRRSVVPQDIEEVSLGAAQCGFGGR